ncbi:TadE/TadG family type IV pilus assembly protein [Novosphingobium profundi]|uniref:TadE/TadG family type IV pilus assembly protein n=1 Tax=Novosphingobium profundi TaxID=1774954 RepID=UPI001CFCFEE2|nr:TadE/TadG family type IV pilus assembly protein [Novosphingobium profundi]
MSPLPPRLQELEADESGVAIIEFALIAPLFLMVLCTGLELANYARAQLRVSEIAMSVADNAGRVMGGIDEANVQEVFAGAASIGESIDFEANGRIVLSSLETNGRSGRNAGQMIRWQRCWGEGDFDPAYGTQGTGRTNDALSQGMGRNGHRIAASSNTAIMFVEASYTYQPLIVAALFDTGTIRYESAFNVRGRQNQELSNAQGLTVARCD